MRFVVRTLTLILAGVLWQWIASSDGELAFLFSSPSEIARVAANDFRISEFWLGIFLTLCESLVGLTIGMLFGIAVGFLFWSFPRLGMFFDPFLCFFSAIPLFAVAPMFIVWFGTGFASKCVMVAVGVFFLFVKQVRDGADSCRRQFCTFYDVMGCSRMQIIRYVIIPGTLRWIVSALELAFGLAFLGALIGEFVSSESGLGHYILRSASLYDTARVLLGVFLMSSQVLLLQLISRILLRRVYQPARSAI